MEFNFNIFFDIKPSKTLFKVLSAIQRENYNNWIEQAMEKELLIMEFGVGFNTPGVIRWPFERIINAHSNATFLRVNKDYPFVQMDIKNKTVSMEENVGKIIRDLKEMVDS